MYPCLVGRLAARAGMNFARHLGPANLRKNGNKPTLHDSLVRPHKYLDGSDYEILYNWFLGHAFSK